MGPSLVMHGFMIVQPTEVQALLSLWAPKCRLFLLCMNENHYISSFDNQYILKSLSLQEV